MKTTKYYIFVNVVNYDTCKDLFGVEATDKGVRDLNFHLGLSSISTPIDGGRIMIISDTILDIQDRLEDFSFSVGRHLGVTFVTKEVIIKNDNYLDIEEVFERNRVMCDYLRDKEISVVQYEETLDKRKHSAMKLYWRDEVIAAIDDDRIVPVFQPIVNKQGKTIKYEALMRVKKFSANGYELVTPFFFLDVAREFGLYSKLTHIMIEKVFHEASFSESSFSINLSYSDILNHNTVSFLKQKLEQYDVENQIVFEILENEEVSDFSEISRFIKRFRQLGVRFAIDDFGAGFSNYSRIFQIEPDYLKIDGSLIKEICSSSKSSALVKSIVSFAKESHIKTIAEFVENKEIALATSSLGVDEFQGYYYSEPLESIEKSVCKEIA